MTAKKLSSTWFSVAALTSVTLEFLCLKLTLFRELLYYSTLSGSCASLHSKIPSGVQSEWLKSMK